MKSNNFRFIVLKEWSYIETRQVCEFLRNDKALNFYDSFSILLRLMNLYHFIKLIKLLIAEIGKYSL